MCLTSRSSLLWCSLRLLVITQRPSWRTWRWYHALFVCAWSVFHAQFRPVALRDPNGFWGGSRSSIPRRQRRSKDLVQSNGSREIRQKPYWWCLSEMKECRVGRKWRREEGSQMEGEVWDPPRSRGWGAGTKNKTIRDEHNRLIGTRHGELRRSGGEGGIEWGEKSDCKW